MGGDKNTPKNATEHDHPTAASQERRIGGLPSFSSSSRPSAGKIPTKPAASGIFEGSDKLGYEGEENMTHRASSNCGGLHYDDLLRRKGGWEHLGQ